ncbi:Eif3-s9p [Chamberlinius hualienensis]
MAEDLEENNESKSTSDAEDIVENNIDEDEPNFSDPEDFKDDVNDDELLSDILKKKPRESDGIDNLLVVDGVPQVGKDRLEKLQNVIKKLFSKFGEIVSEEYPEENGMTKGYIFLEYKSPLHALEALKQSNGYKLDKTHTFHVNLFSDFDKYMNVPDEWQPPEPQPYRDVGNLHSFLLDPDCFDQFSIIYEGGEKTAIWLNCSPDPVILEDRPRWTESYTRFSPLGTYFATIHHKGVALWGAEKFKQIMKFIHNEVHVIDFSPNETYLATFSPTDTQQPVIIWDIRTGVIKRSFSCDRTVVWPAFRWSHDDKYFARHAPDSISVYETPSFGLMEKKSIRIPGVRDFSWSPTDNVIAYWVNEEKDVPARVCLLDIPSRNELRAKNLFSVADCKMHWQKSGDYLCVKVDRYTKVKKEKVEKSDRMENKYMGFYYNLEIFHMREKQIPVDSIDIKENIVAFAWEPIGSKFCLIHGDAPNIMVSFYEVKAGGTASLLKKWERKQCNHIFWSPQGQFVLLAGLRSMNGVLEFIDTADMTVMNQAEHEMCTDVEWDPTGRYVVTGVSWWTQKVDNGFNIWSFQGKLLQSHQVEQFCQLLWRPRPPSLLTAETIKEIRKNLKKYSVQFEIKDRMAVTKASKELIDKRSKLMKEFAELRQRKKDEYEVQKRQRLELRGGKVYN